MFFDPCVGTIVKYNREFSFHNGAPQLGEVCAKMTQITSLPVDVTDRDPIRTVGYAASLRFADQTEMGLNIASFETEPEVGSEEQAFGCETIRISGIQTERTLYWTMVLALEQLGGFASSPVTSQKQELREQNMRWLFNRPVNRSEFQRRHRLLKYRKWISMSFMLMLAPVLLPFILLVDSLKRKGKFFSGGSGIR